MTWAAPTFLAALALLVPIIIAFLVKRQRRTLRVPSTMIWRLGAHSVSKNRRIRDLRRLIALALVLLGVSAIVAASARPSAGKQSGTTVFVVDVSASMSGEPIAEARRFLSRELASMGPRGRMAIVTAGHEARIAAPVSANGPVLEDVVRKLGPEAATAALEEAIVMAEGLAGESGARVVVLSDAPVDADASRRDQKPLARVLPSAIVDNLGIVGLYTRALPDGRDDDEREAVVSIATSSATPRRARLILRQGEQVVADRVLDLAARGDVHERIAVRGGGRLVARIEPADRLRDRIALDDEASLEEPRPRPLAVAMITTANEKDEDAATAAFFVERGLRAAALGKVTRIAPAEDTPNGTDVLVFLEGAPARRPTLPTLFMGTAVPEMGLGVRHVDQSGAKLRSLATGDPLLRGVSLDGLTTMRAHVATAPSGAKVLVDLDGGPTLLAGKVDDVPWVWLGIEPEASDLVLRVAFPVLMGNVLAHLGGATRTVVADTTPRSEVTLARNEVAAALSAAPEPRWRIGIAPTTLLAVLGALLLAFEAWFSFRRRGAGRAL